MRRRLEMTFTGTLAPTIDAVKKAPAPDQCSSDAHPLRDAKPLAEMRVAQRRWANLPVRRRLHILGEARLAMARQAQQLAASVPTNHPGYLHRTLADTLVSEVLPLLDACRFLEREAESILAPRELGTRGRTLWLSGVRTAVHRVPVGVVLILAPGNYPLFLPGVQALQALAAGNAVLWKPAAGGSDAANALRTILCAAGLDPGLVKILDESLEAGKDALDLRADKVFLTGSTETGRTVMRKLAETVTPSVMELSGCDAVFLLEGMNGVALERASEAIVFGLRFNGSATCMAPRRLFATAAVTEQLLPGLLDKLSKLQPVSVPPATVRKLDELIDNAVEEGATVAVDGRSSNNSLRPTVLDHVSPAMLAPQTDIFAPVLSVLRVTDEEEALAAYAQCPYSLTASIFGPSGRAQNFAARLQAGNVLINDLVVATADPRAPFGGRQSSGFGVTRGREGLLEMTAVKTIQIQGSRSLRPYQPTSPAHAEFFLGIIHASHGKGLRNRWRGLCQVFNAARRIR